MRYSFAKAYFDANLTHNPSVGKSKFLNPQGALQPFEKAPSITPAIDIGATLFLGHADIYISIDTGQIKLAEETVSTFSSGGVCTGFRVYP